MYPEIWLIPGYLVQKNFDSVDDVLNGEVSKEKSFDYHALEKTVLMQYFIFCIIFTSYFNFIIVTKTPVFKWVLTSSQS